MSPAGIARSDARIAAPVRELDAAALAELGVDDELRAEARRWRKAKWIDYGFERLERLGLVEVRWDHGIADEWITVVRERELGRAIIAATVVPSVRQQLEVMWDAFHEFGGLGDTFRSHPFMAAYFASAAAAAA